MFIPWCEDNKPPSSFLKRVRETQKQTSKEYLETVLDQELQPNCRPKCPCTCPKVARMPDNQFVQDAKLKMTKEMDKNNIPVTEKTKKTQDHDHSRPPKPDNKIPSDWSDSEDGKDDQARAKPLDTQDPQPSTSFASRTNDATLLRKPNMYPEVLNLGRGRGIAPLANSTSVIKGCRHGIFINQTPQEPEIAVVPPADKIICTEFRPMTNYQPNLDPENH